MKKTALEVVLRPKLLGCYFKFKIKTENWSNNTNFKNVIEPPFKLNIKTRKTLSGLRLSGLRWMDLIVK